MKIGILGYGNIGRGVEYAITQNPDMELVAVFTRRNPESLKINSDAQVVNISEIENWADKIDVLIHMLNVDKGSVEASNMQMLFELIQEGVVGKHIFDIIPYDGKVNSFVAADIDKLYSAYVDGIEPIDIFVPPVESHNEAQALLTVGDVYELEGEEKIFILDKDLNPLQLGIDKETYFELFPPIERYAATQNDIGNCWEVTGFNTLLTDPKERYSVLSLFEQNGDEISISFPSNAAGKIVFEDGKLPIGANPNY